MSEKDSWHVLIPQNNAMTVWTGLLNIKGKELKVHLELPEDGNMHNASVWGDWKLAHLMCNHQQVLESRLKSARNKESFMEELSRMLEDTIEFGTKFSGRALMTDDSTMYSKLIAEVAEIGWDRVVSIESDLKQLELQCKDDAGREHIIKLCLHEKYPTVPPVCTTNLPDDFDLHWGSKLTLSDILSQFEGAVERYQAFWQEMSELDTKTWILEPERPGPAHVSRRIALGNNSSIQITVNPQHPRMLPQCCFLGADHVINPLRKHLNNNLQSWDSHVTLLANLQNVLEVDFPTPSVTQSQNFSEECGICYAYRLDAVIPDQVCDNPQCNKPFHQTCLEEWLRSLPSTHQSVAGLGSNTLYGECPYCSKPMSLKKQDNR